MSKWDDDDDVVRPEVRAPRDLKREVEQFQAKMNEAASAPRPNVEPPPTPTTKRTTVVKSAPVEMDKPPKRVVPEREIKALEKQARASAQDVAHRAGGKRKVRLRVRVSGWYEGSVPAVDFCDDELHFFPHAPVTALETEEEYLEYWRKPFIAQLKALGFRVIEDDV